MRETSAIATDELNDKKLQTLDQAGYTIIPPSGKLRDVTKQLPHIVNTLGCRLLHLLPVNPTPMQTASTSLRIVAMAAPPHEKSAIERGGLSYFLPKYFLMSSL